MIIVPLLVVFIQPIVTACSLYISNKLSSSSSQSGERREFIALSSGLGGIKMLDSRNEPSSYEDEKKTEREHYELEKKKEAPKRKVINSKRPIRRAANAENVCLRT
jgi:hypothetical protein